MGKYASPSELAVRHSPVDSRCHDVASVLTRQAGATQRRSNRATNGSNSDRWQEVLDSAKHNFNNPESVAGDTATDAGTNVADVRPQPQQEQQDEDDRIRCVCGQTEEVEDEDKDFVQCDQCHAWQHNQCVGLPAEIPEDQDYFCEQCRPDLHQKLLQDKASGKFAKKSKTIKKVDRKRKRITGRTNDNDPDHVLSDADLNDVDEDELTATTQKKQRSVSPSTKSESSVASDTIPARSRKTIAKTAHNSGKTTSTKTNTGAKKGSSVESKAQTVEDIKDIERRKIAMALVKLVGDALNIAKEKEGFVPSGSSKPDALAQRLGLQIELALFDAHLDAKSKFRQLSFNLKDPKNPSLRKRVLDGSLLPADLVQMSSEDMANPELKAKTEALREESLKQSVLVQETGPRIRRTHKGEEYVEGPESTPQIAIENSSSFSKPRVREDESESPLSIRSPSASHSPVSERSGSPVSVRRERSWSNFDIKDVWSHIETPLQSDSPIKRNRQTNQASTVQADDNDEDLLGILDGDLKVDPNRHDYGLRADVWHGQVLMPGICNFNAKAILVAGPKSFQMDWTEVFTDCIQIDGRIAKPDATKYLCHQKFSQSKSVFALDLEEAAGSEASFKALYDYFTTKDRFGVIKSGKTRLRDGYIVPLPQNATLPDFITMLPGYKVPTEKPYTLLALLVVEKMAAKSEPPIKSTKVTSLPTNQEARKSPTRPLETAALPQLQPASIPQWQPLPQPYSQHFSPNRQQPFPMVQSQQALPEEDPYQRRVQMTMAMSNTPARPQPLQTPQPPPPLPQLDANAQAILAAFLRAHPEIANNKQITSSPQLMGRLLEEFVRGQQTH